MDQDIFRRTYQEVNERFCAYEKSVLGNHCDCSQAERFCIAERVGVHCRCDAAQVQCLAYLELLRREARFTLKDTLERTTIPHNKAMKVQVGGLRGLELALDPTRPPPAVIGDVHATLEAAKARFGSLEAVPLQPVIQQIAAFVGRKPRRRG
jgi:hypothetical protein